MQHSWDQAYARELKNHAEDAEDEGTIWFDDSGAEEKVIELLDKLKDECSLQDKQEQPVRLLDLGSGNGHMLFALYDEGWRADLVGVDYSEESVQLAQQIANTRQAEVEKGDETEAGDDDDHADLKMPHFDRWDILNDQPGKWAAAGFDAVLDKGTFDAISLSAETDAQGRRVCESYRERVVPLIKPGKFLIITSCNWTKDELLHWFEVADGALRLFDEANYPKFTFGGQQGQSVCTLVFQRTRQ